MCRKLLGKCNRINLIIERLRILVVKHSGLRFFGVQKRGRGLFIVGKVLFG